MDGCVGKRARHIGTRTIPRYVISHRNGGAPKLLRISLRAGDEKALSVLSSGMLARGFLRSGAATSVRSGVSESLTAASWSRCYSGRTRT
jgi:hypothetical protein